MDPEEYKASLRLGLEHLYGVAASVKETHPADSAHAELLLDQVSSILVSTAPFNFPVLPTPNFGSIGESVSIPTPKVKQQLPTAPFGVTQSEHNGALLYQFTDEAGKREIEAARQMTALKWNLEQMNVAERANALFSMNVAQREKLTPRDTPKDSSFFLQLFNEHGKANRGTEPNVGEQQLSVGIPDQPLMVRIPSSSRLSPDAPDFTPQPAHASTAGDELQGYQNSPEYTPAIREYPQSAVPAEAVYASHDSTPRIRGYPVPAVPAEAAYASQDATPRIRGYPVSAVPREVAYAQDPTPTIRGYPVSAVPREVAYASQDSNPTIRGYAVSAAPAVLAEAAYASPIARISPEQLASVDFKPRTMAERLADQHAEEARQTSQALAKKSEPGSWAGVAVKGVSDEFQMDMRVRVPPPVVEHVRTLTTIGRAKPRTPALPVSIGPPEAAADQHRAVVILNPPAHITAKKISEGIKEGALMSIRSGIYPGTNNRFFGIIFQFAPCLTNFLEVMKKERHNNTPERFGFIANCVRGQPHPRCEVLHKMDAPVFARRRITLAQKGLFFNWPRHRIQLLLNTHVGAENVEFIFIYNGGNATISFFEVEAAIKIKAVLTDLMRTRAERGLWAELQVSYSKDPCETELRLISDGTFEN